MTKTTVQILTEARALIADPFNWTQFEYAVHRRPEKAIVDIPCSVEYEHANCFCSLGAIKKVCVTARLSLQAEHAALKLEKVMQTSVARYNDTHTHAEVLAKFDEAIAAAQSQAMGEAWARGAL